MLSLPPGAPTQLGVQAAASAPVPAAGSDRMDVNLSWSAPPEATESLSTPFEEWCAARDIHPDAIGAWECFEASQAVPAVKA